MTDRGDHPLRQKQRKKGESELEEQMEGILSVFVILLFKRNIARAVCIITEISEKNFGGIELMVLEINLNDQYFSQAL